MPSTAECLEIVNEFFIDIRLEASRSHESAETWKFWIEERVPRASAAAAEIRRKMVDMMENGEQRRMATEESYEKTSEITRKMLELMEKQQNDLPLERRLIYPPRPQAASRHDGHGTCEDLHRQMRNGTAITEVPPVNHDGFMSQSPELGAACNRHGDENFDFPGADVSVACGFLAKKYLNVSDLAPAFHRSAADDATIRGTFGSDFSIATQNYLIRHGLVGRTQKGGFLRTESIIEWGEEQEQDKEETRHPHAEVPCGVHVKQCDTLSQALRNSTRDRPTERKNVEFCGKTDAAAQYDKMLDSRGFKLNMGELNKLPKFPSRPSILAAQLNLKSAGG